MGCVQQAVLDFDEEIQAPWRPRWWPWPEGVGGAARPPRPHPSGRSSSRVGSCRPPEPAQASLAASGAVVARGSAAGIVLRRVSRRAAQRRAGRRVVRARPARGRSREGAAHATSSPARVVLALAVGVAIGSWVAPLLAGGDGELRLAGVQSVVVQPGDTLWSIASDVAGTADVRQVVDRIQERNGLQGTVLIPGQVLELP